MKNSTRKAVLFLSAALVLGTGTNAFASGGSGGGGGGGSTSACAGPTTVVVANTSSGTQVAPYWQPNTYYQGLASGKASQACDNLPVVIHFADTVTSGNAACVAQIPDYQNPRYFKYGLKPPSRYESIFTYFTGADCVGSTHSVTATMVDNSTGAVLGSATSTWVAA